MNEFDAYARDYDAALREGIAVSGESKEYFAEQRVKWLAADLRQLGLPARHVLDFGCGTGTSIPYLQQVLQPESIVGVDVSEQSLEVARTEHEHSQATFATLRDFQPKGDIDLVFCNGVLHHVPPPEREAVFRFIADCLRPGGVFAMWENSPWSPAARYVMSRIPFDRDAVMVWPRQAMSLATTASLRPLKIRYRFIFPRTLGMLRRIEPWVARWPLGAQYQMLATKQQ